MYSQRRRGKGERVYLVEPSTWELKRAEIRFNSNENVKGKMVSRWLATLKKGACKRENLSSINWRQKKMDIKDS